LQYVNVIGNCSAEWVGLFFHFLSLSGNSSFSTSGSSRLLPSQWQGNQVPYALPCGTCFLHFGQIGTSLRPQNSQYPYSGSCFSSFMLPPDRIVLPFQSASCAAQTDARACPLWQTSLPLL